MSWVAVAIAGSAVLNAATQSGGASQQAGGYQAGYGTDMGMYNKILEQEQPFISSGTTALNALMYGQGLGGDPGGTGLSSGQLSQGFTPTDFTNNLDPGYQFQLDTGGQAVRNADTPTQGALSGASLKDLMSFNSGMAATGYQNAFDRWNTTQNNIFSRLSGIAGLGQNAASATGTAGVALGTNAAGLQAGAGTALGAGTVGAGNALSGAATPLAYLMQGNSQPSYLSGPYSVAGNGADMSAGTGGFSDAGFSQYLAAGA